MIRVQSALMRDKIQRLLTDHQGSIQFSFDHEQGISLFFNINVQDEEQAIREAKKLIKLHPETKSLLVSIKPA
ncbi:hypothetical protein [Fannyhessea vaginae]|jgi:hypothetical protein|uniref:hypothetical protein n=1 Tax=Fannyhessea vaginae TaxID=82135 RepID=UPI0026EFA9B0|nr:hypothetical protein [Fannyhessea vaginae]